MSLVIERPKAGQNSRRRPATQPAVRARVRTRPVRRRRTGVAGIVTGATVLIASLVVSYVCSSVLGNTMLEQARRDRIRAIERTKDAREDVAHLRREINGMTSMDAVDRWAVSNAMVLSGVELPPLGSEPAPPRSSEAASIVASVNASPRAEASVASGEEAAPAESLTASVASELVVENPNGTPQ